jgi:hypothetical protein
VSDRLSLWLDRIRGEKAEDGRRRGVLRRRRSDPSDRWPDFKLGLPELTEAEIRALVAESEAAAKRDPLVRWKHSLGERDRMDATEFDYFLEQILAVEDERVERGDPTWWPPGPEPENLERLVEDRRRRGVLRPPGG